MFLSDKLKIKDSGNLKLLVEYTDFILKLNKCDNVIISKINQDNIVLVMLNITYKSIKSSKSVSILSELT